MTDVIPQDGKSRKVLAYVAGAAAAYVGYRWWRSRSTGSQGAAAVPVDTSNTAAGAGASGYVNPGGIAGQPPQASGLTTNASWTQAVESDLGALGYDAQAIGTAVGLYLSGQPLTADQQSLIRQAWAFEGKPPENTNLAIIPTQSSPGSPAPGGSGGATPPPGPVPDPNLHYTSDGTISMNTLARQNHSSAARIIAASAASQPADTAKYAALGSNDRILPKGTRWNIPRN